MHVSSHQRVKELFIDYLGEINFNIFHEVTAWLVSMSILGTVIFHPNLNTSHSQTFLGRVLQELLKFQIKPVIALL